MGKIESLTEDSIVIPNDMDKKRYQLLRLQHKINRLKQTVSEVMLPQVKDCKKELVEINKAVGEIYGNFKIS